MLHLTDLFKDIKTELGIIKDINNFKAVRDLISHWINTRSFIKKNRRKGKKIVGICLPPCDLIYAFQNTIPIFPLRLHLGTFDALSNADIRLKNAVNEGEAFGCETDQCVQIRTIYGCILLTKDLMDFWIGPQTCDKQTKIWEIINENFLPVQLVDAPHKTREHDLEKMRYEFDLLFERLVNLTGFRPTDDDLRDSVLMSNEIRSKWWKVYELLKNKVIPIHASTIINILNYGIFDWFSNPQFLKRLLNDLYDEMAEKIDRGDSIVDDNAPRILIAGNGTMEPQLPDIVETLGGVIIAVTMRHEWVYPQVDLNIRGDIRNNIAKHQLEIYHSWRTQPRLRFAKKLIKDFKIDGVIYNSCWGCRRFSPAARLYKDELQEELGIPVLLNDFYMFGEHLDQLKTRVGAFIELLTG